MHRIYFEYFPRKSGEREEVITCSIRKGDVVVQEIFSQEHTVFRVIEWLNDNWQAILNEVPPTFLPEADSYCEADRNCRDTWPDDWEDGSDLERLIEEQYDVLYWYIQRHNIGVSFSGTNVPGIFLGLYKGTLTASWQANGVSYSYEIEPRIEIKNRLDNSTVVYE